MVICPVYVPAAKPATLTVAVTSVPVVPGFATETASQFPPLLVLVVTVGLKAVPCGVAEVKKD